MKLRDYLRERQAVLILWVVFLAALEVMLLAVSEPMLQIYIGIGIPAGLFLDMGLEFQKKKRFYDSVEKQAQEMDQVYLLPEVVEDADFLEGKYLIQFLKEMENSMAERVKAYKKDHVYSLFPLIKLHVSFSFIRLYGFPAFFFLQHCTTPPFVVSLFS